MRKKTKRAFKPKPDETRPTKVKVVEGKPHRLPRHEIPTYQGDPKSEEPKRPGEGVKKPPFEPHRASGEPKLPSDPPPDMGSPRRGPNGVEQYVRIRVLARGDRLSVLDSHLVDGPLLQGSAFVGTNAYEVTLGERMLHAGALPDLGVQRSFVAPDATGEQVAHHIGERETYEFSVRVPAHELTAETIRSIRVRLYRVKGEARTEAMTSRSLTAQFPQQMRTVAEVTGLPESVLPQAIEGRGGRTPTP